MIISTTTDWFAKKFGEHDAVKYLSKVGFNAFDYSMFNVLGYNGTLTHPIMRSDYREYAQSLRKTADENNITCNQAHAPFPSYIPNPNDDQEKYNEIILPAIVRAMEVSAILGAKNIIVHPITLDDSKKQKDMNLEFYNKLLPYCKKFNIKIALENMWGWDDEHNKVTPAVCSTGAEFADYLDSLDKAWFVACIDVGHGEMQGAGDSTTELIYALGRDRLKALHIHDNDKIHDSHTLPFIGKINWDAIMKALKDINYDGDFTFEADSFLIGFPPELYLSAASLMFDVGRYFVTKYEL